MIDESFDMCCGEPTYNFCVVLWPWNNPDDSHRLIAVGEHLCVTPPVIPQP